MPGIDANETHGGREPGWALPVELPTRSASTVMPGRYAVDSGTHDGNPRHGLLSEESWIAGPLDGEYAPPRIHVTPNAAQRFYLLACIKYGIGFGAMYGTGLSVIPFIWPVIYGLPAGAVAGLVLGLFDGVILGYFARNLVDNKIPVGDAAQMLKRIAPFITMIGGGILLYALRFCKLDPIFTGWGYFILIPYSLAVLASWHAARIVTNKFAEAYE